MVAPQQRSVLGAGAERAAQPPARFEGRSVVAKTAPPPAPVSFVKQQQEIQANGGRPPAVSQMRQVPTESTPQARSNIKIAPPAQMATPQNARANGRGQRPNDNGNRPGQPQPSGQVNPNQPPARNIPGQTPADVRNNSNRQPVDNNPAPPQPTGQMNSNKPPAPNNAGQQPHSNQPGNPPATNVREKSYNDRPSNARPNSPSPTPVANPQLDQRHQQQQDQLRQKQQQQLQQLEQKHGQQQQKLEHKQQQERQKQQEKPQSKPPKDEKNPPQHG